MTIAKMTLFNTESDQVFLFDTAFPLSFSALTLYVVTSVSFHPQKKKLPRDAKPMKR